MTVRRFVYRTNAEGQVESFEVTPDYQRFAERAPLFGDSYMDGDHALDGADIGSRRKRREYMQARGLADASDFKGEWEKGHREREAIRNGTNPDNIKQLLHEAWHARRK